MRSTALPFVRERVALRLVAARHVGERSAMPPQLQRYLDAEPTLGLRSFTTITPSLEDVFAGAGKRRHELAARVDDRRQGVPAVLSRSPHGRGDDAHAADPSRALRLSLERRALSADGRVGSLADGREPAAAAGIHEFAVFLDRIQRPKHARCRRARIEAARHWRGS